MNHALLFVKVCEYGIHRMEMGTFSLYFPNCMSLYAFNPSRANMGRYPRMFRRAYENHRIV